MLEHFLTSSRAFQRKLEIPLFGNIAASFPVSFAAGKPQATQASSAVSDLMDSGAHYNELLLHINISEVQFYGTGFS